MLSETRKLLDFSVYIGSALEFFITMTYFWIYGVKISLDFRDPLVFVNFLVTVNMSFTILFASIYTWLRRQVVVDNMRRHAKKTRDWLLWFIMWGDYK